MSRTLIGSSVLGRLRLFARAALPAGLAVWLLASGGCATRENRLLNSRIEGDRAMHEGRYADAAAWYEDFLGERPSQPQVVYELALAYEAMGEPSAAREALSVAHELDPDNEVYIEALARNMAKNGEVDPALDMLERIAAESMRADAHARLGRFLLDQGFADEGIRVLHVAAPLRDDARGWLELADAYAAFDKADRELDALRHAAWYSPLDENIKARIRALGAVPGPTFAQPPRP